MRRRSESGLLVALGAIASAALGLPSAGCSDEGAAAAAAASPASEAPEALVTDGTGTIPQDDAEARAHAEMLARDFPLHGLVTGLQLIVRQRPDPEADPVGWLRVGARVRVKDEPTRTPTCRTGFFELYPQGFACAGQGIEIAPEPPPSELAVPPPARNAPLPYQYFFVKDDLSPEYHRLPTRDEQREARAQYERAIALRQAGQESRAERVLAGEAPGEPPKPAVVHRYLDRGFFVASTGVEARAFRRFVRTVRNRFVKEASLETRSGSDFVGVELGGEGESARSLPIAWAVRAAQPMRAIERADGTTVLRDDAEVPVIERHAIVDGWQRRGNVGGVGVHVLEGERYVRDWFLSVAERVDKPREVGGDEPWAHVDLSQQTLVVYVGETPAYATLVSSGLEGFTTPTGLFTIRRKYIADTMANIGDGLDDRYSIEDVPWTQYFDGSVGLHGAFWHDRFGLVRSHGCVNLSPRDAHRVFDMLWPHVPDGWLGVTTEGGAFRGSHVLVTE